MRMKLIALGLLLGLPTLASPVEAGESTLCPSGRVRVTATGPSAVRTACEAAAGARRVLGACGIQAGEVLQIKVVDGLPEQPGLTAIGLFDPARVVAVVPTFAAAFRETAGDGWFDHPMTMPLYRSLIAHETAHAIVDQTGGAPISPMAQEYVAYAVQFGTMSPELREAILDRSQHTAPIGRMELSGMYMALAPSDFGIKAHLHFSMAEHGCAFLRGVAEGVERLPTGLE